MKKCKDGQKYWINFHYIKYTPISFVQLLQPAVILVRVATFGRLQAGQTLST